MIFGKICAEDLAEHANFHEQEVRFGGSVVGICDFPGLERIFLQDADRWLFTVREKRAPFNSRQHRDAQHQHQPLSENSDVTRQTLLESIQHPLDFIVIDCQKNKQCIRIITSSIGGFTFFFKPQTRSIHLSNILWPLARGERLNIERAAHFLEGHIVYDHRQMYNNVYASTAGSVLTWSQSGITITEGFLKPYVKNYINGSTFEERLSAFDVLLRSVCRARIGEREPGGLELSGGVDSAAVAVALKRCNALVHSATMIVDDGPHGHAQRKITEAVATRCATSIAIVQAESALKNLTLLSSPDNPPAIGDIYIDAFDAIWEKLPQNKLVFTGLGGDELCGRYASGSEVTIPTPRETDHNFLTSTALEATHIPQVLTAVAGSVDASSLLAMQTYMSFFAGRKQRPVSPLCDPRIVSFARSLPACDKWGKKFLKQYISKFGTIDDFTKPEYRKIDFTPTFTSLLDRSFQQLNTELATCTLTESGVVDHQKVKDTLVVARSGRSAAALNRIALFLTLERFNRSL